MTVIDLDEEREDQQSSGATQQACTPSCIEKSSVQKELADSKDKPVKGMQVSVKTAITSKTEDSGNALNQVQKITINTIAEVIPAVVMAANISEVIKTENYGLLQRAYLKAVHECKTTITDITLGAQDLKEYCFEIKDKVRLKYLELKKSVSELINSWTTSAKNLYERCKCALHDGIKATGRILTSGKINIHPTDYKNSAVPIHQQSSSKVVHTYIVPEGSQYSDIQKLDRAPIGFFKKIAEALEQLTQAFSHKKEEQRRKEAYDLETKQKKLEEEASEALSEARFLRPDLADKLRKPQLAFLASSPFAHAPSAEDLISQAEDESKEQIH